MLLATSTADAFFVVTGWLPALQAEKLKLALVCSSLTGNFQYRVCYRLATTSTQDPGAWTTAFDQWRTAGEACTGMLTPAGGSDMWIQVGIQYALSSGSALGQASVSAVVAAKTT